MVAGGGDGQVERRVACLCFFLRGARYEKANMKRHISEGDSLSGGHKSQALDVNMGLGSVPSL